MQEELKFIDLNEDKSPKSRNVTYPDMTSLINAGLLLNDGVVVIDFDNDNGIQEEKIIKYIVQNYPTLTVKTTKGYHFYYSKPKNITVKGNVDVITVGGFQIDYRTGNQYVMVKQNGVERERNRDLTLLGLPELPQILYPIGKNKTNLSNMSNGDGRNDGIFRHLCSVRYNYPTLNFEDIGNFINYNIFTEPLSDNELTATINSVLNRDIAPKVNNQPLEVISALELKNTELKPIKFIVEDMLPQGLNLICSPPKYGKSWLMLDLCLSVASGNDFLRHKTRQCGCLYLALEDSKNRLKDRMLKLLKGANPSPNFDFSIRCGSLGTNLIEQLTQYINSKPNTELIVIDTLQKVRGSSSKGDSAYGSDYKDLGILKAFADEKEICLLLVHHLRKMKDTGDAFAKISGTNAIMGACDTIFVLDKEKRTDTDTKFSITGRDVDEKEYVMIFDKKTCYWNLIGDYETQKQQQSWEEYNEDYTVRTIKELVKETGEYKGTISDINSKSIELFGIGASMDTGTLGRRINSYLAPLLSYYDGITHERPPVNGKGGKREHKFIQKIDLEKKECISDLTDTTDT